MTSLQSAGLIATALASVLGCYTVSLHAANERSAIVVARDGMARDVADMRLLRAELRTRSRLPELQRWNEQVLALAPPRAEQLMASPVMLAAYATPGTVPAAAPAAPVTAVVRDAPVPAPVLQQASFAPDAPRGPGASREAGIRAASDLETDAARVGMPAALPVGFRKVALR